MKKLLALLLALVMVLGLAACGTSTTTPTAAPDNAPAADNAETAAPTAAELEPLLTQPTPKRPSRRLPTLPTRQSLSPSRSGSTAAPSLLTLPRRSWSPSTLI